MSSRGLCSMNLLRLVLLLSTLAPYWVAVDAQRTDPDTVSVGEEICFEGYIMDWYCIDLGVLFDNRSVETLVNPGVHSVHCLVDVERCKTTNFEILADPEYGQTSMYTRAYNFGGASRDTLIQLGQSVGAKCSSCTGTGTLERGFRAEVRGTVVKDGNGDIPPTVQLLWAEHSNGKNASSICQDMGGTMPTDAIPMIPTAAPVVTLAPTSAPTASPVTDAPAEQMADPNNVKIGDEVCFEGFVMDNFCINLGTLLDNRSVETLMNPEKHSVHCLVDIPQCRNSNYEILMDPTEEGAKYTRAFQFEDDSKAELITLARSVGAQDPSGPFSSCSSCTSSDGTLESGFRAEVRGTVMALPDGETPATLRLTSAPEHSNDKNIVCGQERSAAIPISGAGDDSDNDMAVKVVSALSVIALGALVVASMFGLLQAPSKK